MSADQDLSSDTKVRVVSLANLKVLCERASGMCHRYVIDKVARDRVHVTYSNPDEYGSEAPMTAVFPAFVDHAFGRETTYVVLGHLLKVVHDNWHGEGWQAFDAVVCGPELSRSPTDGKWRTREEIERMRTEAVKP